MARFSGGCQCGDVRYEIDADPVFSAQCSCRDCQMASGTGHSTFAAFPRDALNVTGVATRYTCQGESGGDVTRAFCPRCGSRLYSFSDLGGPLVMITASSLDDPASVKPTIAIYQKSAQPWDHVDPGLQKFPGPPTRG